jgi:hypothetical protein
MAGILITMSERFGKLPTFDLGIHRDTPRLGKLLGLEAKYFLKLMKSLENRVKIWQNLALLNPNLYKTIGND